MRHQPDVLITWPHLPVEAFGEILEQAPYAIAALWAAGLLGKLLPLERAREALALIDRHFAQASEQRDRAVKDEAASFELRLAVPRTVATAWLLVLSKMCDLGRAPEVMAEVGGEVLGDEAATTAAGMLEHARRVLGEST